MWLRRRSWNLIPGRPRATPYWRTASVQRRLKRIADERGIAVLVVHDTRKQGSEDWLDMASGTNGLAGACGAILILKRQRGAAGAELLVTGRDVEELKLALEFQPDLCQWQLLDGPAEDYELGDTRRAIVRLLRDEEGPTPKQVSDRIDNLEPAAARQTMRRMVEDEQLDTDGSGRYFALPLSPVTPVTEVTDTDGESDGRTGVTGVTPSRGCHRDSGERRVHGAPVLCADELSRVRRPAG